jgi:hypothetical protein
MVMIAKQSFSYYLEEYEVQDPVALARRLCSELTRREFCDG